MRKTPSVWSFVLFAGLLLPLLTHMYNGFFSRIIADDYCTATDTLSSGLVDAVTHRYWQWNGRYTNVIVKGVLAPLGAPGAALLPALLAMLWLAVAVWTCYQIARTLRLRQPFVAALLLATGLILATLDGAPLVMQSLYWTGGAIPYTLPLIMLTLFVGFVIVAIREQRADRPLTLLTALLLTFTAGGLSEVFTTLEVTALALAGLAAYIWLPAESKRPAITLLVISLIGAAVALLVVMIAPGNSVRQAYFVGGDSLLEKTNSLPEAVIQTVIFATAFIVSMLARFAPLQILILGITAYWVGYTFHQSVPSVILRPRSRWLLLGGSAVVLLLLVMASIFPGVYATAALPPGRAYPVPLFAMSCVVAAWGMIMGFGLRRTASTQSIGIGAIAVAIVVVATGLFLSVRNLEITPQLRTFATEWDARDQLIREQVAQGETNVIVQPLSAEMGALMGLNDLEQDGSKGFNDCAADYYGVESLTVVAPA
ncbi:MAG: DUF6056 family protein [Anaerolineae bacterium]|nr:DUF6056 family protein [Anaerolineae bacterium]